MSPAVGTRLGPYELLSPLGTGGMGEVWKARDPRLAREVAIKVLPTSFSADPDRLRRFEQEAKAAGLLNHPNVTAVYDIGSHGGVTYVVSELLEGETLRAALAGGGLPVRKAADYAVQIAQGLAAAHGKGIVHRDLKPENLFVTKDGRIKILDFGLAKLIRPEESSGVQTDLPTAGEDTEPGVVLGTLGYMAPEQVRGRAADVRSDIFAFGAILYEMLSGRRAFQGDSAADTMSAILKEDPPDLPVADRNIPPGLERIVRHCLEKNPEERFQSARDLAFDLSAAAAEPPRAADSPRRRPASLWIAASLGALLLIAAALLWKARIGRSAAPVVPSSSRKSIAVLPFQNLSPDPQNAFFADGMTEDILTQLAKIRNLKVISRTSVMRYKGTQKPVREIARELDVGAVLEGSVRRAGDRVRIVGQLVDARTDEHLWAETYDRDIKDVFAIQSEVAQKIAAALQAALSPAEKKRIEQSPTRNLAAYDLYLQGRELYNHYRKADNEAAIELFQKALALDPGFALAYAGLGDAYAQRAQRFGFPQSWMESSMEMSRKAVALDPEVAEGHKALGLAFFVKGAYRQSIAASRRAVEINPNQAPATANVGFALWNLGKPDEALPWLLKATELDPRSPPAPAGIGGCYATLREPTQAERWWKRSLELQPDLNQAHTYLITFYLSERRDEEALEQARKAVALLPSDARVSYTTAIADLTTGNLTRARELLERVLSSFRGMRVGNRNMGPGVETCLAYVALRGGRQSEAAALLKDSLATDRQALAQGNEDWSASFDTACVHALRGEKDEAFRWLDSAVDAGWRGWPPGTRLPLLDPLRSDPRFQKLEGRIQTLVNQMRGRAGLSPTAR